MVSPTGDDGSPRRWTAAAIDVHDASVLIGHVEPPGRDVLRWLAVRAGQRYDYPEIARGMGLAHASGIDQLTDAVARAVHMVEEFCVAFRTTPLVAVADGRCSITPHDASVVIAALALLDDEDPT